ncbi:MAG: hypothetical protein SchgKO_01750 [Schleiferiaceae bacterium]
MKGLWKGFVAEITSLLALILGLIAAYFFSHIAAPYVKEWFELDSSATEIVSFITSFAVVYIAVLIAGKALEKFLDMIALGAMDHLLGAVFGFLKYALFLSLFIAAVQLLPEQFIPEWFNKAEDSKIYPFLESISTFIFSLVFEGGPPKI